MNPELNQDDLNIEDFLYECLDTKNEKLNTDLDVIEVYNHCLTSTFEYYAYYEETLANTYAEPDPLIPNFTNLPDEDGGEGAADNNVCYYSMYIVYSLIPIFTDTESCDGLKNTINQILGQVQTYLNSVDDTTQKGQGIKQAKPFIENIENAFQNLLVNIGPICELYGWN